MAKIFLIVLINALMLSLCASAQNPERDFKRINDAYKSITTLLLDIDYKVYKNHVSAIPLQTEKGIFKKKGDLVYYKIGNIETIKTASYNLVADHDAKTIALLEVEKEMNNNMDMLPLFADSILHAFKKTEFSRISATLNAYTLFVPGSEYEKIKIFYNGKSFFVEKLELYYRDAVNLEDDDNPDKEAPRLEITFYHMDTHPVFSSDTFSYSAFLVKNKNKYYCKAKYQGYQLITQVQSGIIAYDKNN